jgi:hypothetical protein
MIGLPIESATSAITRGEDCFVWFLMSQPPDEVQLSLHCGDAAHAHQLSKGSHRISRIVHE